MTHLSNRINYPDRYLLKEDYRPSGKLPKISPWKMTIGNLPIIALLALLLAL